MNTEKRRIYLIENKEKIRLQRKLYRERYKEYTKQYNKKYRLENKEKIKQLHKKYYDENLSKRLEYLKKNKVRNRLRARKYRVRKDYGITWERYVEMYEEQWGRCAICGVYKKHSKDTIEKQTVAHKNNLDVLHIDHCHNTNKVRGLLCTHCNKALGIFKEDVNILENAINYLKYFSSETIELSSGCGKGNPCPVL